MIRETLRTVAPLPWNAAVEDGERWGLTVIAGDGKNVSERPLSRDEARFLAALHAFAPTAMLYVEGAAEKGGQGGEGNHGSLLPRRDVRPDAGTADSCEASRMTNHQHAHGEG